MNIHWLIPILTEDDPIGDFSRGFKEGLEHKPSVGWLPEYTFVIVAVVILYLIKSGAVDTLFLRYRSSVRSRRKERRKREMLTHFLLESSPEREPQVTLLKRLVRHVLQSPDMGTMTNQPDDLLRFSQKLIGTIQKLEFNKRGRLELPEIEKADVDTPARTAAASKPAAAKTPSLDTENMSEAAKSALAMIRHKKPLE